MKLKIFLICVFTFMLIISKAQSIPTFWMNYYPINFHYNVKDRSIVDHVFIEDITYGGSIKYTYDMSFKGNDAVEVLQVDYRERAIEIKYVFNAQNELVGKETKQFLPIVGENYQYIVFKYNSLKEKTEEIHLDADNKVIRYVNFYYNDESIVEKIEIYNKDKELISYETADYLDSGNSYIYRVFNSEDVLKLQEINNSRHCADCFELNEFGDYSKIFVPTASNSYFVKFKYKYDQQGNWIKRIKFDNRGNKLQRIKREITYKI